MKKKLLFLIMIIGVFAISGCGKNSESDVIKDLTKKINDSKAYYVDGTLEIVNNEDVYTYNVNVSYKEKDNYKVSLVNTVNNHEQIINCIYLELIRVLNFKAIGHIIIHKCIY